VFDGWSQLSNVPIGQSQQVVHQARVHLLGFWQRRKVANRSTIVSLEK